MKNSKKVFLIFIVILIIITSNIKVIATNEQDTNKQESNQLVINSISEKQKAKLTTTNMGIGGGGALFFPVISPFDSKTLMVTCDMGGAYVSHNAGESWERKNTLGTPNATYCDPSREGVMYVGGSGLWRSTDNGDHFTMIFPREDDVIARRLHNENSIQYLFTKSKIYPHNKEVTSIVTDPNDSNHIFVAMYYSREGIIFESTDNGENFHKIFTITQKKADQNILYELVKLVYKQETGELYCVTDEDVFKYDKEKGTATSIYQSNLGIINVVSVFENNQTQFIVIENTNQLDNCETEVYYTNDFTTKHDLTQKIMEGLPDTSFENKYYGQVAFKWKFHYIDATSLDNIYLTHENNAIDTQAPVYPYTVNAVIKFNGTKSTIPFGSPFRDHNYIKNRGWNDGCTASYGIAVSRQNPDTYLQTTLCGANYSPNSIDIYQCSTTPIKDEDGTRYVTNGIDVQNTYGVRINPFNENNILLLNTDLGLIRSEDNGKSWVLANNGIKTKWVNTIYDAEFDKNKEGVVYSIWSGRHNMPYYPRNERDNRYGGFAISYDAGKTWDCNYSTGLPEHATPVKLGIIYPENKEDEVTIYLTTCNEGFFVSYDSGRTFTSINNGIEPVTYYENGQPKYQFILGADLEIKDGRIFGMTARTVYNNQIQNGEVFELIDGKWEKIDLVGTETGKYTKTPRDIYYHDGVLYITATCTSIYDYKDGIDFSNHGGGVLTYQNGEIKQIFDETIFTRGVQIDSRGTMYISDMDGNIYRKTVDGEYQKIYENFQYISKWLELKDDNTLYLTTYGGGLLKIEGLESLYEEEEKFLLGDIDNDGQITVNDLALLKLHLIEKKIIEEDRLKVADMDQDGKITINDLAMLKLCLIE